MDARIWWPCQGQQTAHPPWMRGCGGLARAKNPRIRHGCAYLAALLGREDRASTMDARIWWPC
eukprot:5388245-Karenia_brevis.AAC.1